MSTSEATPLLNEGLRQRKIVGAVQDVSGHVAESAKGLFSEWITFIQRGNVVDLAVGIIMGAAFGAIVNSFVDDLISPWIGLLVGNDLDDAFIVLNKKKVCHPEDGDKDICLSWKSRAEAKAAGAITFNYGRFLQLTINFFVISIFIFFLVKSYQRAKDRVDAKKKAAATDA
ncbi:large-conductance mechanosensitive channel [Cladochytrium replicatum]|nr:large-conductance mechanosensitive channel [Cladochytrium replicatum]